MTTRETIENPKATSLGDGKRYYFISWTSNGEERSLVSSDPLKLWNDFVHYHDTIHGT